MTSKIPIPEFRNLDETNRSLLLWQGLSDTWAKLEETIEHQKSIEADTRVHDKLLISGNGEPTLVERVRNLEKFQNTFEHWAKLIGGALLLNFIAFFVGTMVALIRFLPVLEKIANNP